MASLNAWPTGDSKRPATGKTRLEQIKSALTARTKDMIMEWQNRGPEGLGYTERDFKVCDFCGALNPTLNTECLVCGWSGRFHNDRETVREAMDTLKGKYGNLDESLFMEEVLPDVLPRQSLWASLWGSIRRLFSRA